MANDWFVNNKYYNFFGVDSSRFKLDDKILEAVEDPDDGYRSCLQEIKVINPETDNSIFFDMPVDMIQVVEVDDLTSENVSNFSGYLLQSVYDGHVWLYAGTEHWDDYYPSYTMRYCPRDPYDKLVKS
jgi:hypothetical protein